MVLAFETPTMPRLCPRMWLVKESALDELNAFLFMGYAFADLLTIDLNTKAIIGQERFAGAEGLTKAKAINE
jgi:hypothetical protein